MTDFTKYPSHLETLPLIEAAKQKVRDSDTYLELCREHEVDPEVIDYIPVCFGECDVSARTERGIVTLNFDLLEKPEEISHYLIHEFTHVFQQCFGDKPTKGSTDANYLKNPYEIEGFQQQSRYIAEKESPEEAEQYIDKVLDHHDQEGKERQKRKEKLLELVEASGHQKPIKIASKLSGAIEAWHCGKKFDEFSLDFLGQGENNHYLGPGIYFITSESLARRYAKYHKDAWLYRVQIISAETFYNIDRGLPLNLREASIALQENVAKELSISVDKLNSPFDSFKYGKAFVGGLVQRFGRREAIKRLKSVGINGIYENLRNAIEICVFDLSLVKILDVKRLTPEGEDVKEEAVTETQDASDQRRQTKLDLRDPVEVSVRMSDLEKAIERGPQENHLRPAKREMPQPKKEFVLEKLKEILDAIDEAEQGKPQERRDIKRKFRQLLLESRLPKKSTLEPRTLIRLAEYTTEGQYVCVEPGCQRRSDDKKDFLTVLDAEVPGLYCKYHAEICESCHHAVARDLAVPAGMHFLCRKCYAEHNICEECKKPSYQALKVDPNGRNLCPSCWSSFWVVCPNCKKEVGKDELLNWRNGRQVKEGIIGCPNCMATCTACDRKTLFKDEDEIYLGPDEEYYCGDCYGDIWGDCEECNRTFNRDELHFIENAQIEICNSCYREKYAQCHKCHEVYLKDMMSEDADGDWFCEECYEATTGLPAEYSNLEPLESAAINPYTRLLDRLKRLLPISVQELKHKDPQLAMGLKNLIIYAKGKQLTSDIVAAFEAEQQTIQYPIKYSVWRSTLQRSIRSAEPQLVINVLAPPELLQEMEDDGTLPLFEIINQTSKDSGHPFTPNQLGWIRVELHSEEKYILVDEIQCDHQNALEKLSETTEDDAIQRKILNKLNVSQEQLPVIINELKRHIKNFGDVAVQTVLNFAKKNGFTKVYYHTYESGKKLKNNAPPRSIYTQLPKRHFFEPTEDKPFALSGQFLGREARVNLWHHLLRIGAKSKNTF